MHRNITIALKWIWAVAVVAAVSYVIYRSREDVVRMLHAVPTSMLMASLLLTAAAKFFLGENARLAAARNALDLSYGTAIRLYNLSQLGKYLPGSIWQFVGRAAAYRNIGGSYGQIRDSLLVESLWIISGAAAVGILMCGPGIALLVDKTLTGAIRWWFASLVLTGGLTGIGLLLWKRRLLARYVRLLVPSWRVIIVQLAVWGLLGMAFWVLANACQMPISPVFSIGLFAAAYAMGFLVPFAPAGLGVRDGILMVGLLPYATAGEALAVTVMARLIYLVVELLLVALQSIVSGRDKPVGP